jgi:chloramphenicol O-acetyltransferase
MESDVDMWNAFFPILFEETKTVKFMWDRRQYSLIDFPQDYASLSSLTQYIPK